MGSGHNGTATALDEDARRELDRVNARMRHFQGVAASVMEEAQKLWLELWEELQDPRTPEEIIDGAPVSEGFPPVGGRPEFMEKLYLLGHYIDYTRRLCDGSISEESEREMEV